MATTAIRLRATSEEEARRVLCEAFADMAGLGYGQFRLRWFPTEQRVRMEGEKNNRWTAYAGGEAHGPDAALLASVIDAIRDKRNDAVQVFHHRKADEEQYVIRVDSQSLQRHAMSLAEFLRSRLFWG